MVTSAEWCSQQHTVPTPRHRPKPLLAQNRDLTQRRTSEWPAAQESHHDVTSAKTLALGDVEHLTSPFHLQKVPFMLCDPSDLEMCIGITTVMVMMMMMSYV